VLGGRPRARLRGGPKPMPQPTLTTLRPGVRAERYGYAPSHRLDR
jgi:hypothetical protein